MNIINPKTTRGFTVIEFLGAFVILTLVIAGGIAGFRAYQSRSEVQQTLRAITSALNTARFKAIGNNRSIKVTMTDHNLVLSESQEGEWSEFQHFQLDKHTQVSMNASPVFSPTGFVAPLCSITVKTEQYAYKITISIAGRLKTVRL